MPCRTLVNLAGRFARVGLVSCALSMGCVIHTSGSGAGTYTGPECDGAPGQKDAYEQLGTALICGKGEARLGYQGEVGRRIAKIQAHLDVRHFDHLKAGLMVLACAEACDPERDAMTIGMLEWFTRKVDPERMTAGMTGWALSAGGRTMLVGKVSAAKTKVAGWASSLGGRERRLFIDVPNEVRDRLVSYYEQHASLYDRLDAIVGEAERVKTGGRDAAPTVASLIQLRGEYLAPCRAADCRYDPLVVDIGRQLVLLHLATRNDAAALAEWALFEDPLPYRNGFAPSVAAALYLALSEEHEARQAYSKMKDGGADEATLAARFGSPPPARVDPGAALMGGDEPPNLVAGLDTSAYGRVRGVVANMRPTEDGTGVELSFREDTGGYEPRECAQQEQALGADLASGRLVFGKTCRSAERIRPRGRTSPVIVPKGDAATLRPGDDVVVIAARQDGKGYVVRALDAQAKLVQFRGHRLDPSIEHPPLFRASSP